MRDDKNMKSKMDKKEEGKKRRTAHRLNKLRFKGEKNSKRSYHKNAKVSTNESAKIMIKKTKKRIIVQPLEVKSNLWGWLQDRKKFWKNQARIQELGIKTQLFSTGK